MTEVQILPWSCNQPKRYTFMNLVNNPSLIDHMGEGDAIAFLERDEIWHQQVYTDRVGRRHSIRHVRERVQAQRDAQHIARKEHESFIGNLEAIHQFHEELTVVSTSVKSDPHRDTKRAIKKFGSRHRSTIFDLQNVSLGLKTVGAYISGLPVSRLTPEHVFPRTPGATSITEWFFMHSTTPTISDLIMAVIPLCSITYATSAENNHLNSVSRKMEKEIVKPDDLYRLANIQVVDMGIELELPHQWVKICNMFNVDTDKVLQRLPKFTTVDPNSIT